MNIVLINPPYIFSLKRDIVFPQCLGLLYIAASLIKEEHNVVIINGTKSVDEVSTEIIKAIDKLYKH